MENKLPELPYERNAMVGGEMPDGLEWYDRKMFLMLRMLYHQYKCGIIDRETAKREKRKLLQDYEEQKSQKAFSKEMARRIIATDAARAAYRKNRTLENADALIFAFDNVEVKKQGAEATTNGL